VVKKWHVAVEPQVFDLLSHLINHRDRVVSKDELLASVWHGRIVSESALFNRINAVRTAIGDTGSEQRLIKTLPRKGIRFVGDCVRTSRGRPRARNCPRSVPPQGLVRLERSRIRSYRPDLRSRYCRLPI
jgi:DNA-binding winged helix-turn-helix (wHTH) protein